MKPEAHEFITKAILKSHICKLGFNSRDIKYIVKGTMLEDWWPPRDRIRNWHFYRGGNSNIPLQVDKYLGVNNPTSIDRVNKLVYNLKTSKYGSKKQLKLIGRIIHHIQDMSTPSHVVPIFHGGDIEDSYETHMMTHIKDMNIDEYINMNVQIEDFSKIYIKYAESTLNYLDNSKVPIVGQEESNTLFEKIWMKYKEGNNQIVGFGKFGVYAECFSGRATDNIINIDIQAIYKYLTLQAAQSTYDILMYYKNHYS